MLTYFLQTLSDERCNQDSFKKLEKKDDYVIISDVVIKRNLHTVILLSELGYQKKIIQHELKLLNKNL